MSLTAWGDDQMDMEQFYKWIESAPFDEVQSDMIIQGAAKLSPEERESLVNRMTNSLKNIESIRSRIKEIIRSRQKIEMKVVNLYMFAPDGMTVHAYQVECPVVDLTYDYFNPLIENPPDPSRVITKNEKILYEEGDLFVVRIDGENYLTQIIKSTQFFIKNPDHYLVRQTREDSGVRISDFNQMFRRYQAKEFSQRDYAELNIFVGYSVSSFHGLSSFQDMRLENPLWRLVQPDDTYLSARYERGSMTKEEVIYAIAKRDKCPYGLAQAEVESWGLGE